MITLTINKSDPDAAAMLEGCEVGQAVQMEGKITADDETRTTVEVESLYKSEAEEEAEPEAEPEPVAGKGGMKGMTAIILKHLK